MPRRRKPRTKPLQTNYIQQWRAHRDKTQAQLAEFVGISESHLSRIERGEKEYNQSILEAAAEYLATDVASLLMRDPTQPAAIWSLWEHASVGERQEIARYAEFVLGKRKKA